jgi:iron complex transport system substrate-binding protein
VNRVRTLNLAALAVAIVATVVLAWPRASSRFRPAGSSISVAPTTPARVRLPNGEWGIVDASGTTVPLRSYTSIVSTNLVTDRLLVEMCERTRIRAVSRAAAERKHDGYRYAGLDTVDGFGPVEAILVLKPDLVLMNSFGAPGAAERLRNGGVQVFDLGQLRGTESLVHTASSLGELLGQPERARSFVESFERRMKHVATSLGAQPRKTGMFLSILGPDLQAGARGTSYHDIMVAAGLRDVAERDYQGWPALSAEQVLALAPEIIVTRAGSADRVCKYPGMEHLLGCRGEGAIVELPGELLDEPGPAMLDAAELLFSLVYRKIP